MDSRLLASLNAQASSTRDPVVWAKAVCRAAAHYAGQGKTQEALTAIGVVRGQFGKDLHFDIASWLMLAEGVLHYYRAQFPEAYDRVRRAYGLAIALKNISAFPSCAAWMAHLEYNAGQYELMAQHISEAAQMAKPSDHQAIARYSMILAISYHIAGHFEMSRPWYEKARLNAAAEGDNATVSATLHNMAATRASNIRLIDCFGGDAKAEIRRVILERGSSYTYDKVVGLQGLDFLSQMLDGLVCTLDGRHEEALAAYLPIDTGTIPARFGPLVDIDRAWCLLKLGHFEASREMADKVAHTVKAVSEHDDLAYTFARLGQIHADTGNVSLAEHFEKLAKAELTQHHTFQQEMLQRLKNTKLSA